MSSYEAIAAVSRTLKGLLEDQMVKPLGNRQKVTLAPPDVKAAGESDYWLNLYLYQITENGSLKNQDVPQPPLCLNLHYLLTAYAREETVDQAEDLAQQILGDAMRVLHDFAILTPKLLKKKAEADGTHSEILDKVLLEAAEQIKITLHPASLDELSKIWTSLPQSRFRRSVAYEVSVIEIDSARPGKAAPEVKTRKLHAAVTQRPQITAVYRTPANDKEPKGDPRVKPGEKLTLEGSGFSGLKTWVRFGALDKIRVKPLSDTALVVAVPDDRYPIDAEHPAERDIAPEDRLKAGPRTVEVIVERATETVEGALDHGKTGQGTQVVSSNQAVFFLVRKP